MTKKHLSKEARPFEWRVLKRGEDGLKSATRTRFSNTHAYKHKQISPSGTVITPHFLQGPQESVESATQVQRQAHLHKAAETHIIIIYYLIPVSMWLIHYPAFYTFSNFSPVTISISGNKNSAGAWSRFHVSGN